MQYITLCNPGISNESRLIPLSLWFLAQHTQKREISLMCI